MGAPREMGPLVHSKPFLSALSVTKLVAIPAVLLGLLQLTLRRGTDLVA